jgi:toxin CcdB
VPRFDLYRPRGVQGLLLDVQSNFTSSLATRVVVPLLPAKDVPAPLRDLHPVFRIGDHDLLMATQLLAAVPKRELGRAVGNLEAERDAITRAFDMLLIGF